jgi:RimJ/RimL family protein N-acetyltransferase
MNSPNLKQISDTTLAYYSLWIGQENILLQNKKGIEFLYSEERNKTQQGYGVPFDIYIFKSPERTVISYGSNAKQYISTFADNLDENMTIDEIGNIAERIFHVKPVRNIKYVYSRQINLNTSAVTLTASDFHKYKEFFEKCHHVTAGDWLYDYFIGMAEKRLCCGFYLDNTLVSCTDAPDMPYMNDKIAEIGVNTLPDFYGKGFATECCKKCISNILENDLCPIWSTSSDNLASQALAERIGFEKTADVITLTL